MICQGVPCVYYRVVFVTRRPNTMLAFANISMHHERKRYNNTHVRRDGMAAASLNRASRRISDVDARHISLVCTNHRVTLRLEVTDTRSNPRLSLFRREKHGAAPTAYDAIQASLHCVCVCVSSLSSSHYWRLTSARSRAFHSESCAANHVLLQT